MQAKPVTLSRRLYYRIKAWYLRQLDKSLAKQRAAIERALSDAASKAQANALQRRPDASLQELRQLLRADHQVICTRQLIVSRELRELGAAA